MISYFAVFVAGALCVAGTSIAVMVAVVLAARPRVAADDQTED